MDKNLFNSLSLHEKEMLIKKEGQFIEAEDDYSYRLVFYNLHDNPVELMYDNESDQLVSVTFIDDDHMRNINVDVDDVLE